jgi:hypothetical protein
MRRRRARFLKRLAAIEAQAPTRRRKAERFIHAYYRAHRTLPRGTFAYLPRQRVYSMICVGELEHRLRLARVLLRLSILHHRAAGAWARLRS